MAQVLNLRLPAPVKIQTLPRHHTQQRVTASSSSTQSWASLSQSLKCNGRFSCLFSGNRKQEEARKALESALGGKKTEFEKWNNEIKKREEAGGGGNSGGGGWFGWRGWFGGSDGDDRFWQEAQQASLAILGIFFVYLIVTKGDVMIAVIFNPLLFALRGTRTAFAFLTSKVQNKIYPAGENFTTPQDEVAVRVSAKDRVVGKWGSN